MPEKRPAQDGAVVLAPAKKQRNEMVIVNNSSKQLMQVTPIFIIVSHTNLTVMLSRLDHRGAPTWMPPSCY